MHFAGLTANPDEGWMLQVARNFAEEGFLRGKNYLLMDRDTKFSEAFRVTLEQGGLEDGTTTAKRPELRRHITSTSQERVVIVCEAVRAQSRNQLAKLAFRLAGHSKPGFRSIDIGRESGALPTQTIEEMRN